MLAQRLVNVLMCAAALRGGAALATEWTGGTGDFDNAAQWSPAVVPGAADTAVFNNGGTVTFNGDVSNSGAVVSNSNVALLLNDATIHYYTLTSSAAAALSVTNGSLTVDGGLLLPNSGMLFSNSNITFKRSYVSVAGRTEINDGSVLNINAGTTFSAGDLVVANTGAGSLIMANPLANLYVSRDLSLAAQPGAIAHMLTQNTNLTVQGNMYIGGNATGPGGIADVQFTGVSNISADHLVVYQGSSILANQCTQISTQVAQIAGDLHLVTGSSASLRAQSSITLLSGSHTIIEANTALVSPTITVSSGALLTGSGFIGGNLTNAGEFDLGTVRISPIFPQLAGNFTQLSGGLLQATAGASLLSLDAGTAQVDGTLRLLFTDTTGLHAGSSFALISARSITGAFNSIELVGLDGFEAQFSDATGRITLTGGPPPIDSGDGSGEVATSPGVPEPMSLSLLGMAMSALACRLRRRPIQPPA